EKLLILNESFQNDDTKIPEQIPFLAKQNQKTYRNCSKAKEMLVEEKEKKIPNNSYKTYLKERRRNTSRTKV
ncbi:23281_t:CDS:2, partial [Dentiscutata erythropus]